MDKTFFAYPSSPPEIGIIIEEAIKEINSSGEKILSWRALNIIGNFIEQEIVSQIKDRVFVADVTYLNYNVIYEIGFAIGNGQKILITKNSTFKEENPTIIEVGIFDTLGYAEYTNSDDLVTILKKAKPHSPHTSTTLLNNSAPVFLLETKQKTDFSSRISARIKKTRLTYRSFDPNESPRLSAYEAITQVAQSHGVIMSILSKNIKEHEIHNIRAAFIAGLAYGMNKVRLILQFGNDAIPIDYRDFVNVYHNLDEINPFIHSFATDVVESMQQDVSIVKTRTLNTLEKIDLGASAAENEMRTLRNYYLKTDGYYKAIRGEVQLVIGRKGSGKSAVFLQIRDAERSKIDNTVLDLKPDGYKLIKFKEQILDYLEEGTFQHTIMAFWEYILLLEICHKVLETGKKRFISDQKHYKAYKKLENLYHAEDYLTEGDFSERMSGLMDHIRNSYQQKFGEDHKVRLSAPEITSLLYQTDIKILRESLVEYLVNQNKVWLLFDNVDKGWPASGLQHQDLTIIRALIDATRKIQHYFEKHKIDVLPVIFLRNDVYDLLVVESPDRQKEAKVLLDWTDPDLLRQIIRLRILSNPDTNSGQDFEMLWRTICVSHFHGEDSFQYITDRSLMRPRFLLNLINHCRSFAVNLNHNKIKEEDIEKGLAAYSADLLTDINLEIRDIYPDIEGILNAFIDSNYEIPISEFKNLIEENKNKSTNYERIADMLLWYGFVGIKHDQEVKYIFSTNYSIAVLKALIIKKSDDAIFAINPGFWPALMISAR